MSYEFNRIVGLGYKSMDDLPNVVHSFEYCMGLADILVPVPAEEQPADPGDCGEWTY